MPLESAGSPRNGQEVLVQLFILAAVLPMAANAVHDVHQGGVATDHIYLAVVREDDAPLSDSQKAPHIAPADHTSVVAEAAPNIEAAGSNQSRHRPTSTSASRLLPG